MYFSSSENKGADQLCGYRKADLRLVFTYADCWLSDEAASLVYVGISCWFANLSPFILQQ